MVINKPWGYEYLLYETEHVGVWFLHINQNESTSLHCHQLKETGLVLLRGEAQIRFLNRSFDQFPAVDKITIHAGVFHATKALSVGGIDLLEFEHPNNKEDLIRLEDNYGRIRKPYESIDKNHIIDDSLLSYEQIFKTHTGCQTLGCNFEIETILPNKLKEKDPFSIVAILENGLFADNKKPILKVGEVIKGQTYNKLIKEFEPLENTIILTIDRCTKCKECKQRNANQ